MKLSLYYSNNDFSQDEEVITNCKSGSHIFVVPDRFAMSYEKKLFEVLHTEALFNMEVVTLSRLASRYFGINSNLQRIDGVMLVQKILSTNKLKFKVFGNSIASAGFAEIIYDTIMQFKSCKIAPDKVSGSPKLDDIALVYTEYENMTKDYTDSADKFEIFGNELEKMPKLDEHFHFCHFDGFTEQGYNIIKQIIRLAPSVSVSLQKSSADNGFVYQKDVENKLLEIAKDLGLTPEVKVIDNKARQEFKFITEHLFVPKPSARVQTNRVVLYEGNSLRDELDYTCKQILKLVKVNNYRYKDIAVVMPGLDSNEQLIKQTFAEYGIKYFVDSDRGFDTTIIWRYITSVFGLCIKSGMVDVLDFVNQVEGVFDSEDKKTFASVVEANRLNLDGVVEYDDVDGYMNIKTFIINNILPIKKALLGKNSISEFSRLLLSLIDNAHIHQSIDSLLTQYIANDMLLEHRFASQEYGLFVELIDSMNALIGDSIVTGEEYVDIIKCGLRNIKISTVPLTVDSVFVGDASKSMLDRPKVLFVLNAIADSLPLTKDDSGIISDREIIELSDKFVLEPSMNMINLRERQKTLNLLSCPQELLFVSYSIDNGAQKSQVLTGLEKLLIREGEPIKYYNHFNNDLTFLENMASMSHSTKELVALLRKYYDGQDIDLAPYVAYINYFAKNKLIDMDLFQHKNQYSLTKSDVFFVGNKVSVSEVERYYECPFMHFLDYGIRVKDKENNLVDSKTIGNILHRVAELFVKQNNLPISKTLIKKSTQDIVQYVINTEFANLSRLRVNKPLIGNIIQEAVRMCDAINYQLECGKFKPVFTEARFGVGSKLESITIQAGGKKLCISGIVDRIDEFKDYFRIIDYKTGNCDTKLAQLYYGKKIQLHVYNHIVSRAISKKPCGVYYFPVKRNFDKLEDKYSNYKLRGDTLDSPEVILASDQKLATQSASDILAIKLNKGTRGRVSTDMAMGETNVVELPLSSLSKVASEDELLARSEYAIKLLEQACKDIVAGTIIASPLNLDGSACEYCKYKAICRFDTTLGTRERNVKGNKIENFSNGGVL